MRSFIGLILIFSTIFGIYYFRLPSDTDLPKTAVLTSIPSTPTPTPLPTIILKSGLPDFHLIHTPFVPQAPEKKWSQPWQDACEEASLLTAVYYYNNTIPSIPIIVSDLQDIFSYETDNGWSHDISLNNMSQIAKSQYNLNSKILENPSLHDIKQELYQDNPVIVTANGKTLFKENKNFKDGGPWYHSLVILGFDDNKKQFTVHDVGTQFGSYFKYSYDLLLESIHDLPPSGDKHDIDLGAKRVLVLLQ